MRHWTLLLVLLAFMSGACGSNEWVDQHNVYRCMHGVPEVKWSSSLAEVATWRANNCSQCDHCMCEGSSCQSIHSHDYAENATCYVASAADAVDAWYSEIGNYDYANPVFSNSTGHFINVVVNTATKVGCACNEDAGHCSCDYDSQYGTTLQALSQVVLPR